jgi:hypothetical protein
MGVAESDLLENAAVLTSSISAFLRKFLREHQHRIFYGVHDSVFLREEVGSRRLGKSNTA